MAIFAFRVYRYQIWGRAIWSRFFGSGKSLNFIAVTFSIGFIAGWIVSFTPIYVFADYKDYYLRLSPLIHWFTFVSFITLAIAITEKYGIHWSTLSDLFRAQKKALVIALVSLIILFLVWILIATTGIGIRIVEDYWYGTGVPILGMQVVLAFLIGIGVFNFEKTSIGARFLQSNFLIFIAIWIVAAFFWVREPLPDSFFAPGPYLPNLEVYPYSDAALFDMGSQFALIGQGINNGIPFDRVLYMGFLVFLHTLAGQNYLEVIAWQTAIYAIFPAILYLLGKAVHSRTFGIILAVLAILRGINGIAASNMIDLANQKQMLTDFPMVIFVAWFSLMMVNWLKAPGGKYLYVLWAGGAMGLAIMVRTHALFLLLFGVLSILLVFRHQLSRGILVSFLLMISMLASVLPWGLNNHGAFFEIYKARIQARYSSFLPLKILEPVPTPEGNIFPSQQLSSVAFSKTYTKRLSFTRSEAQNVEALPVYTSIVTNFFHNLITSVLILPATTHFHDLWHTLKEALPFWGQYWDGKMDIGAGLFIAINLLLISLGIGIGWKSAGISSLVPLGVFFFYNTANAFARTSGGRYIVPADWVVFFYFSLGLLQVVFWGRYLFGSKDSSNLQLNINDLADTTWTWKPLKSVPWILVVFLFAGSLLPLSEKLFPQRYSARSQDELLTVLEQDGYLKEMGLDKAIVVSAAEQWPSLTVVDGRALYPRFFLENKGLPKNQYPYGALDYPRLGFTVLGPQGITVVVLPKDKTDYFPNASNVIVLGCKEADKLDALAVVVMDEKKVVYVRQPEAVLQCPLQQPVCNEEDICR